MRSVKLGGTLSCVLLSGVMTAGAAYAQTDAATASINSGKGLDEIVVTARKREESLIKVPVAVTALSAADLNRYDAADLTQISRLAPQLIIARTQSSAGASFTLRGIGSSPDDAGLDSSVLIILDGVPISRGRIVTQGMFDLQQVEVLKGPQALFFGKNSPAGVVSLKSAGPGNHFGGVVKGGYEFRTDERFIEAAVDVPLSDTLKARLAVRASESAGYIKNVAVAEPNPFAGPAFPLPGAHGERRPAARDLGGRMTVVYSPTNNFDATFKMLLGRDRQNNDNGPSELICRPGVVPMVNGIVDPTGDCKLDLHASIGAVNPLIAAGTPHARDGRSYSDTDIAVGSLTLNYRADKFSLTSVTGYSRLNYRGFDNFDFTSFAQITSFESELNKSFTQEFRANSDWEGPLHLTGGAYYESYNRHIGNATTFAFTGIDPATGKYNTYEHPSLMTGKTYSVFGQLRWDITNNIELDGGARYTHETKTQNISNSYVAPAFFNFFLPVGQAIGGRYSGNNFSPEFTISWHPEVEQTIYASYKQGYKSGGFSNPGILTRAFTSDNIRYKPESAKGGEIGYKAQLFDRSLRIEADVYYYTYANLQLAAFDAATLSYNVRNAGKARTKGVEVSTEWRVAAPLTLRSALSYNKARYLSFPTAQCSIPVPGTPDSCNNGVQNLGGHPLVRAPDWVGTFGASFDTPVSDHLMVGLDGDARYTSSYYTEQSEDPTLRQGGFWLLNASLRLHPNDNGWELALIGKNLLNKIYFSAGGQQPGGAPGAYNVNVDLPRTVELQATLHF